MTTYTITKNHNYDSNEVYFDNKPARDVLDALKKLGMKWNHKKSCWYGFASESELVSAILEHGSGETVTGETTTATVCTDGYLGGGAVYGSKSHLHLYGADLVKAMREDLKSAGIKGVTLRRKSYSGGSTITATVTFQPEDITPASEYIDNYRIIYGQGWIYTGKESVHVDKYYSMTSEEQRAVRYDAAVYDLTKYATTEQQISHYRLDKYTEFTPAFLAKLRAVCDIVNAYNYDNSNAMVDYFDVNFYFDLSTKPANPTTPDFPEFLASYYIDPTEEPTEDPTEEPTEDPTEEPAEEVPEESAEDAVNLVSLPLTFFSTPRTATTHETAAELELVPTPEPDPATAPTVTILWSEHPRIADGATFTLSEACNLFGNLDYFVHSSRMDPDYCGMMYYKTKFRIDFIYHGQRDTYEGRQDLGDGDGDLIDHIRTFAEYYTNNPDIDKDTRTQYQEILNEFVPYLTLHRKLDDLAAHISHAQRNTQLSDEYKSALLVPAAEYVRVSRQSLNNGIYNAPDLTTSCSTDPIPLF